MRDRDGPDVPEPGGAAAFERHRPGLVRHAYRMLGDHAEAEDAVQDAYLRWHAASARVAIADDAAYLRAAVTRLCLDRLRSARARREVYVGPWLPEPLVEADAAPDVATIVADDVAIALLLALERLSPLERAAFLLHDVMGVPFAEIATVLDRRVDAVKQLAARARVHVRERRAAGGSGADARRLRDRFARAIADGNLAELQRLLAHDVVYLSDANGSVPAATVPVVGPDRVGRLLIGLRRKAPAGLRAIAATVNGAPGFVFAHDAAVVQTLALDVAGDRIAALYATRDPAKLRRVDVTRLATR